MDIKGILNILAPWEFGTEKGVHVSIIGKKDNQFLLCFGAPYLINGNTYKFLLFRRVNKIDMLDKGCIPIEMVYCSNLSKENFKDYDFKDFRDNFLFGELILS